MSLTNNQAKEMGKLAAWQKGVIVHTHDPNKFRKDRFGNWIEWNDYGKTSDYGWEIDHIVPTSLGGLLGPTNEVATHWKANRMKSNRFVG